MKNLTTELIQIYREERFMFVLLVINLLAALSLLVFSLVSLNPSATTVKIGYGDIGGYRSGVWADMLAFPLLAINFGLFHNLIALRIYKKRGAGMTKFFLITTATLIAGTFIVLLRLLEKF